MSGSSIKYIKDLGGKAQKAGKAVAYRIAAVQAFILLFVIYIIVIGPISILIRLVNGDLLNRRIDDKKSTFWIDREEGVTGIESCKRQF
ncbi:MAG: hypothetical protein HQ593_01570 [Candidatus Omnitrophica bacterium]|nr:hypothetical protein [Candidatus Omnitrophota bacterium]